MRLSALGYDVPARLGGVKGVEEPALLLPTDQGVLSLGVFDYLGVEILLATGLGLGVGRLPAVLAGVECGEESEVPSR